MSIVSAISSKSKLGTIVVVTMLLSLAGVAETQAGTCGSLAYGEGGGHWYYGFSYNYSTRGAADARAMQECGASVCSLKTWFCGGYCGALARASNGAYGYDTGETEQGARQGALGYCRSYGGSDCEVGVNGIETRKLLTEQGFRL